jgi:hypothetical protein
MKYHVGIDLHRALVQVCVLDGAGEILEERWSWSWSCSSDDAGEGAPVAYGSLRSFPPNTWTAGAQGLTFPNCARIDVS